MEKKKSGREKLTVWRQIGAEEKAQRAKQHKEETWVS
jgi:hypothetical protein